MLLNVPSRGGNFRDAIDISGAKRSEVGKILAKKGIVGYEPTTLAAAPALVETYAVDSFADVGANIGVYSWFLKSVFGRKLRVRAYEPLPALADIVQSISDIHGLDVETFRDALSDRSGTATFYVSARSDSSNSLAKGFRPAKDEITVSTVTMDEAFVNFTPKLIKIDTESTEPAVLAGGDDFVAKHRPWMIVEVLAGRTEKALQAVVDRHGYRIYRLDGAPLRERAEIEGDLDYRFRDWLLAPEPISEAFVANYTAWLKVFGQLP